MKILVCSDAHGNWRALRAVLEAYEREEHCDFLFLGDAVGYCAHPRECMDTLLSLPRARLVLGNHEAALLRSADPDMNEYALEAIRWTKKQLGALYEASVREKFHLAIRDRDFFAVHASPSNPASWIYIFTDHEAEQAFISDSFDVCFVGHTHQPAAFVYGIGEIPFEEDEPVLLEMGKRYIFNVGSVGQPRDGDPRAAFAFFDTEKRIVKLSRVEYDVEAEAADIRRAGLPSFLAERLAIGI